MKLPTIERPIDNTALKSYMRCPRLYDLSMRQGYRSKEKSQALSGGAFWHTLLETWYKTGNRQEVVKAFEENKHKVPDTGDYRTAQRYLLEFDKYLKEYNPSQDLNQTVGFPDNPMVEIQTAISAPGLIHEYAGKLDRIIKDGDLYYVEDHKTTSRFDKHFFRKFDNDNQMMGYVWMARQLLPDAKVVGARINVAHILTSKSAFHRHIVTYSDTRMAEWEANTNLWLQRLAQSIESDQWPAAFGDNGCRGIYGLCEFFGVCSTNQSIRQAVLEQEFEIRHWDPLAVEHD